MLIIKTVIFLKLIMYIEFKLLKSTSRIRCVRRITMQTIKPDLYQIFFMNTIFEVLELFRKEFREIKSGLEKYEVDNNNDFPMLKSYVNTERDLRKIFDESQLKDYTALLERCFDNQ